MTTVRLVISVCLPVPRGSFPGCTSPPDAVTWPRRAAPGLTGHTAGGGGRSKHTHSTLKTKKNELHVVSQWKQFDTWCSVTVTTLR